MTKRYVLFATLPYAYAIFRPLQAEILSRGDEVAWYLESGCENYLKPKEVLLNSIDEVVAYNPIAIFACGNHIYHFLPGIKVALFHGYAVGKRGEKGDVLDDHFTIHAFYLRYRNSVKVYKSIFKNIFLRSILVALWRIAKV